jgi:hypothetical protein
LVLRRTYRTLDPTVGPFGVGLWHRSEPCVRAINTDMALLITPENFRPPFAKQPYGSFANLEIPTYLGARVTKDADNTWTLRFKDGTTWSLNGSGWHISQVGRTVASYDSRRVSSSRRQQGAVVLPLSG